MMVMVMMMIEDIIVMNYLIRIRIRLQEEARD